MLDKGETVNVLKEDMDYSTVFNYRDEIESQLLSGLGKMLEPGQKVVIKPNFVRQSHLYRPDDWEYVITHPSVIRIVLEYVVDRLDNNGEVAIVDAPQTDSDYDEILRRTRLPQIVAEVQATTNVQINYYDLREERWFEKGGVTVRAMKLPGDPEGYVSINLKEQSEFCDKQNKDYYGADYDREETLRYHNDRDNIYVMSRTVLESDVFINLPKMKTHKLAGVTGCLKNLVGTCVIKNSIPHHTLGTPETQGDSFPTISSRITTESNLKKHAIRILKKKNPVLSYPIAGMKKVAGHFLGSSDSHTIRNGAWYGNDTIWRSVLDLNKIVLYADKDGVMHDKPQRKYFTLIDGIIGGEGEGPMAPDPRPEGVLISGTDPVSVDAAMATLMGFDYKCIPTIYNGFQIEPDAFPLTFCGSKHVNVKSNCKGWNKPLTEFRRSETLAYRSHFGWQGYLELEV